ISDSDCIKVFVRVRPVTQGTGLTTDGDQSMCLTVTSSNTIRLLSKPEPRTFTYDHVADMDTSQDSVFSSVAKNIVESCMNGYNGTIFAYGQTGSGKTFTMLGPSELDNFTDELRGVIPRSFEYLFFLINREVERSGQSKSFLCKCSFIEIYNEQIYDLLDTASASLFLRENIKKGLFVEGAVEKFVNSAAEAYQVLSMGWRNRRVASTSMNRESSRSHAVFTMTLESKESINEVVNIRTSQLNLVDLAGSERQKDTNTEGSRLKEASSINRSLMCLGQVIMALVDVSNGKNRHICYRDSKLTFLLRDSLGGNAKTYIIANVHPGSKCFGETLSTLQFAQRAKLIKNKAIINEDTQGNVRQLQAEVKKLKEQLSQLFSSGPSNEIQHNVSYKAKFMAAVRLWKKREEEKRMLLQKVAQLEEAWTQKDKFIHSSRMIVRFREDHISRLERKLKEGQGLLSDKESQALIDQLKEEIKILRDQVEHHPKMTRYAAENFSLRQENRQLRSLESVVKSEEAAATVAAELDEAFQRAMETERLTESKIIINAVSAATTEKLKAQLLQKQSDLAAALHAFEEYKEVTKKQMSQLESEKRYLDKSNRHLENILEATNTYKTQEVCELNRIHVETIKILTTPTKAYNLRSRIVPLSSPDHLNGTDDNADDIWDEQPPSDMTEMALTEELRQVQEQTSRVQTQLNEEELKNSKLLQQIAKLEEQIAVISQECAHKDEVESPHVSHIQFCLYKVDDSFFPFLSVLRSEIRDLRLVLQSSDKELATAKNELRDGQSEQQREMSELSNSLISTQLQLDKVQLEWEQLLEQHRTLQDSFDQLQAEAKFEADQAGQQLQDRQQEIDKLKAQLTTPCTPGSFNRDLTQVLESQERELENRRSSMMTMEILLSELNAERAAKNEEIQRLKVYLCAIVKLIHILIYLSVLQENDVLRKQNIQLSEENGKLVGHRNHKQRIEYLVKLKKENTKLQEENEKLRTEMGLMRDHIGCPPLEMT
uniref:Kinesin-like protein n=1 Tax=Dicentrarchus labrax TaxID=13489 RepID=A0A8C4FA53_DICLA